MNKLKFSVTQIPASFLFGGEYTYFSLKIKFYESVKTTFVHLYLCFTDEKLY